MCFWKLTLHSPADISEDEDLDDGDGVVQAKLRRPGKSSRNGKREESEVERLKRQLAEPLVFLGIHPINSSGQYH